KVGSLDKQHASTSSFRPHAEKIARFLSLLDRLLGGVTVAIQANPDISSIAVGGIKLIIDISVGFTRYFGKLTDMLDRLSEIIAPLERYAERFELLNVGNALIDIYGDILDFCKAASALFLDRNGKSKVPTTLKIFLHSQWVPFEAEFGDIAGRMNHHCNILLHAAQAELLYADKVKEREGFLRWLSPYDFHHKQNDIFKTKHEGTGDWLLQTAEFERWATDSSSQLLWCYGKPGAGKSVLASHVINHIQQNYAGKQTGLCFAYFSFTDLNFQDLTLLVALLLKQLCQQHDVIPERLLEAKRVTELYERSFVIVDGLDECPEEKRSPILDFIVEASSRSKSNVKILVSSRKEYDINDQFKCLSTPAIELETGIITLDIHSFVQHEASRLRAETKLRVQDDKLFEEIVQRLVEKSDGMFLWVSLQLQQLCRTSRAGNDQYLKQSLDHLPQGLVAMYTRIFDEIANGPVQARNIALECFRWMMYAKAPPSPHTLEVAVALLEQPLTEEDLKLGLLPIEYILEACRNLLRLPSIDDLIKGQYHVAPVHFSFLEFLQNLTSNGSQSDFWAPLMDSRDAHSNLTCRCVDWLLLALPEYRNLPALSKLSIDLEYPAKFFDKHAVCATSESSKPPMNLLTRINNLLGATNEKIVSLMRVRLTLMLSRSAQTLNFDEALSKDYVLWTSDLHLVPGLEIDWAKLAIPQDALHLAVWFCPGKLDYLLSNGHCVNELDGNGRTPLWYACDKGDKASVEILLRAGAIISTNIGGLSPLALAVEKDNLDIAKILLQADTSSSVLLGFHGETLLMMVKSFEMVQLLCESYNSDVNATDSTSRSVLSWFVGSRKSLLPPAKKIQIVDYLISRGADLFARSKAGMDCFDEAVRMNPNSELLEYLLERNPNLAEREAHEWTPLHWACRYGNLRIAKILLEHRQEAKKVTTIQPPQSWTPYDLLVHFETYGIDEQLMPDGLDDSILYALGRSKEAGLDIRLQEDLINYEQLLVEEDPEEYVGCYLCTPVEGSFSIVQPAAM
ncbi:hypothetical protein KCU65_g993, partial [Aureobasidium melanogenum]